MEKGDLGPLSFNQINRTVKPYTEVRQGFSPANPNVGTVTHNFDFVTDPWVITSTSANTLCTLSVIKLSISKIFNPNNSTDSFLTISWNPSYNFHAAWPNTQPLITLQLLDENLAMLDDVKLGVLSAQCGVTTRQTATQPINPTYFDRIDMASFSLAACSWLPC